MNGRTAALAALIALGCSAPASPSRESSAVVAIITPPPRDAAALFQTDSLSYTLRDNGTGYEGFMSIRFTNLTGSTAYFVNCSGATSLHLEKLEGTEWRVAWAPVIPLCLSPAITVEAGAIHDSQLWVFGAHPNTNTYPTFQVSYIPGIYRIVWRDALSSYQDRLPFGTQLPFEQRISNRFALTVEKRK